MGLAEDIHAAIAAGSSIQAAVDSALGSNPSARAEGEKTANSIQSQLASSPDFSPATGSNNGTGTTTNSGTGGNAYDRYVNQYGATGYEKLIKQKWGKWSDPTAASEYMKANNKTYDTLGTGGELSIADQIKAALAEQKAATVMQPYATKTVPTLSFNEALSRATAMYQPLYKQKMESTLENVDKDTIKRGFFGQLPAAALKRSTAAQVQSDENAASAAMANQLVGQSEDNAYKQQQLALQEWQANTSLQQALNNAASQDKQSKIANLLALWGQTRNDRELDSAEASNSEKLAESIRQFNLGYDLDKEKLANDTARTNYDINKPYYSPNGSGSNSGSKAPTATERLEAYRKGYVDFGIRQLGVIPYNAEAPYNAFRAVQSLMNQQLADTGLKNTDYNDILKQVALAVGYEMPDKKSGGTDEEELM